jgi:hypothetical protein
MLLAVILPVFSGCSIESDPDVSFVLLKSAFELNYEQTAQIEAKCAYDISYSSENEYVAKVSPSGLITGGRVGKTNITLKYGKDSRKVQVEIVPKHTLFTEPVEKVKFGALKQEVRNVYGAPFPESGTSMLYSMDDSIYTYVFIFDVSGKLSSMEVRFDTTKMPPTLVDFLKERYQPVTQGGFSYLNEKKDMLVEVKPSEDLNVYHVIYSPYTGIR